jgi:hypothetical protein
MFQVGHCANQLINRSSVDDTLRCTSTGRECDGYVLESRPQFGNAPIILDAGLLNRNHWAVKEFSDRTLYRVAGFFYHDLFWNRLVLQLSQSEPAISKALSAVNMASAQLETGSQLDLQERCISQSYNKAIRSLAHYPSNIVYVPLAGCILLVCLEFLRGDMRAALTHVRYGWRILESFRQDVPSGQTLSEQELMTELSSIFERLNVHALLFEPLESPIARPAPIFQNPSAPSITLSTFAEAKSRNYELVSEAMGLILSTTHLKYRPEAVTLNHIICQIRMEAQFQRWRKAFDQLYACQQQSWSRQECKAADIVLIQNIAMKIWISTCLSPEESAFDKFKPEFEKLVDLAARTVGTCGQELCLTVGKFQFDMGLIPPLHFIGMKCRWPLLRRKVLRILGSTHWREGLFDSFRSYRCLHLITEIEETGLRLDPGPKATELDEFSKSLPTELSRIHLAVLGPVPISAKEQTLTLGLKPTGVFNAPVVWETIIPTFGEIPLLESWFSWSP